ncbi:piggyBac transposable element-derived protein 4-like [Sitophilus oryzae]|uniref:PiggyBac transposable element-derived protein 4-like n=1 Tax=Sitophilus oryzae TaxID=7048 RepID=A0A6J2XJU2_SITOR|nr:piggyBac transposable element-derived protein 4-like [Sitophilus oryzae]
MLNGLENKEHIVYFDNFFNSTELLEDLKKKLIHACGTVNPSRKTLPVFKPDRKLKRGEFEVFSNPSRIVAFKWRDKRSVYLLSNFHSPFGTTEVNRKEKNGTTTKVRCPQALSDYNANMNFVDKFDQNLNLYKINRKSKKWWHRIFFYFLDAAVVNAFVLYKELHSPKISMKEFRRSVSQGLVADLVIKNKRKAYSCGKQLLKNSLSHSFP